MKYLLYASIFFMIGCNCDRYIYSSEPPIFYLHKGLRLEICKGAGTGRISLSGSEYNSEVKEETYKLPNDSTAIGFVLYVSFEESKGVIPVGKGSEFYIGKCKFRVLEVDPFYYNEYVDSSCYYHTPHIKLQTIAYPNFCRCENEKLKELDTKLKNKNN